MKYLISIILSLCIVTPVHAGMTYENYIAIKKFNSDAASSWMAGAIDGIYWMSAVSDTLDGYKIFCWPPKLKLSVELAESLLKYQYEKLPVSAQSKDDLGFNLIIALIDNFGCNKKQQ